MEDVGRSRPPDPFDPLQLSARPEGDSRRAPLHGVEEVDRADVSRVALESEPPLPLGVVRIGPIDETTQYVALVVHAVFSDAVGLDRSLEERYEIEPEAVLVDDATGKAAPGVIRGAKDTALVLVDGTRSKGRMDELMVNARNEGE